MSRTPRAINKALVVEDDKRLVSALTRTLATRGIKTTEALTLKDGMAALSEPYDLAIIDVRLPDGSGVDLCRALCEKTPRPVVVVLSGAAVGKEGFELARLGVGEFLEKPFEEAGLWDAIAKNSGVPLAVAAAGSVGTVELHDAQASVRKTMIREAFARSKNITATARLLGVTRQAVQQALDDLGDVSDLKAAGDHDGATRVIASAVGTREASDHPAADDVDD